MTKKIYLTTAVNYGDDGIGVKGHLPWHLPVDLAHFRKVTMGKSCAVGYRTFIKLPYLDGRFPFIVPRTNANMSMKEFLDSLPGDEIHVIGGAETYARAMPYATHMWMTRVNANLPSGTCDAFFPKFDWNEWELLSQDFPEEDPRISIMHLERIT